VNIVNNDLTHWKVKLFLDKDAYSKNQFCYLDLSIPDDYPSKPPNIKFDT
jgi:ubiquitin-protein ligase